MDNSVQVHQTKERLLIYSQINEIDWFSFNQIYSPLIGSEASFLYSSLLYQKRINQQLNIQWYSLEKFLQNQKIDKEKLQEQLRKLESVDLAIVTVKKNIDLDEELSIKLNKVKSLEEALKDKELKIKIQNNISKNKLLEFQLLTEESEFKYEEFESADIKEEIIDIETYCEFYNGVLRLLNSEFSISNQILKYIRDYYLNEKKISMKNLQEFAYTSSIKNGNKYEISEKHFEFLIKNHINKSNLSFNFKEHKNFWSRIKIENKYELESQFKRLFGGYECISLYKLLTRKSRAPDSLYEWIKDSTNKKFSFSLLNGIMSFVMTLIGKVSVNYLSKLTNTLYENNLMEIDRFIDHVRNVVDSDLSSGKNRLNVKTEESINEFDKLIY